MLVMLLTFSNIAVANYIDTTPQFIETINTPNAYKTVTYNKRYTFAVPKEYDVKRGDPGTGFLAIITNTNKVILSILEIPSTNKVLYNPVEFGLRDYNRGQLLSAIYDKNFTSNKVVNETRKEIFKLSSNIQVFKRDEFVFYKETRLDEGRIELTISNLNSDDVITVGFYKGNEEFLMNFIKSLKAIFM